MAEKLDTATRREQIAEAALRIASRGGLAAITCKELAREVGLTPSGLYRHYEGKGEILDAVLEWVYQRFQRNITAALQDSTHALDVLHGIMTRNLTTIREHSILPLFFLSETLWEEHPDLALRVRTNIRNSLARFADIIAQGQRAGQIRAGQAPEQLAVAFFSTYSMPAMLHARDILSADIEGVVQSNWRLFRTALAP